MKEGRRKAEESKARGQKEKLWLPSFLHDLQLFFMVNLSFS